MTSKSEFTKNVITLRSVWSKSGNKWFIQPCRDPKTGRYPDCVKPVNSFGDIIVTDKERNSGTYFIKETDVFIVEDGTTFDLDDPISRNQWEAIKNCPYIAPERFAKDKNGNLLIDGVMDYRSTKPRYGVAELYIERAGEEAQRNVSKVELKFKAQKLIFEDPKGSQGRLNAVMLLGKDMSGFSDVDVKDYLLSKAETDPQQVIDVYTGDDIPLRYLFMDAKRKNVIYVKNKLYIFADNVILGATDAAVITWMKDPKNHKVLDLIRKDTYPDLYMDPSEDEKKSK